MTRRYVFIGAGAIGSALRGLLAHHGRDVLLVARGDHARAMAADGLTLRCPDVTLRVAAPTVTAPEDARLTVDDVLILTTKSHQAAAALDQWADVPVHDRTGAEVGRAADHLPVLTALNGVASEEIALRYVARVFAVCVWCPAVLLEPGEVIVRSTPVRGIFHVGRYAPPTDRPPAVDPDAALVGELRVDWEAAGFRVIPTVDVMRWKHQKLLANLNNVVQALCGGFAGAETVQRAMDAEAREVLSTAGAELPDEGEADRTWHDLVSQPVPGEPEHLGGSSWQSLMRGSGAIETDFLNGEIVLMARRQGRDAPVNAGLTALARRAAREGRRPGWLSAGDLEEALGR